MAQRTTTETSFDDSPEPSFERKFLILIDQCRRFDRLATALQPWAHQWPTKTLATWLKQPQLPTKLREMILTLLAIKADRASRKVLDAYDSTDTSDAHRLFHRACVIEWEQRHQMPTTTNAAA